MKTTKWLLIITALCFFSLLNGCKPDPEEVVPQEVITTLRLTFIPVSGGDTAILEFQDIDGDGGGNAPIITTDTLNANTNYTVSIEVLNESVNPADTITKEIVEENEAHQFFFQP